MRMPSLNAAEALTAQMGTLRPKLHRYCASMVGSAIDAEDVVQDALLVAQQNWPDGGVRNVEAWLMRIAHNKAIDHLRAAARRKSEPLDDVDLAETDRSYDKAETAKIALSVFLQLTPLQRACVILKDILGYALSEIAEMLEDQSTGSIKSALHRGRSNLKILAAHTTEDRIVPLEPDATKLLNIYAQRFQDRDISGIRKMLLDDVRLDLVAVVRAQGKDRVGKYFGKYQTLKSLSVRAGQVEGHPALRVEDGDAAFVILLGFENGHVAEIRDFHFARYEILCAEFKAA